MRPHEGRPRMRGYTVAGSPLHGTDPGRQCSTPPLRARRRSGTAVGAMGEREDERSVLRAARRVVVKVGTRVLTHDDGSLALARLFAVVEALAALARSGREVLLVSSGALGLGRAALGLATLPEEIAERQALAAIGQSRLMGLYEQGFGRLGLVCAQVLLTRGDFDDRDRYLHLRRTLLALLARGAIPVINENDVVSSDELRFLPGEGPAVFGDNDRLSALVATKLDADLLLLLSDVDGVYARDPRRDPTAPLLPRIDDPAALPDETRGLAGFAGARGGMRSKLEAAAIASRSGTHAVIASGRRADTIARVLAGERCGTWIPARTALPARARWIAFATAPRGVLHLDAGAVEALRRRGASLLAAGVRRVDGAFAAGDVVELRGPAGAVVGRGRVRCGAEVARRWCAGEPPAGVRNHHALVHRDDLVLEHAPPRHGETDDATGTAGG
ncbi:MAG: glutamate 5-kinase [Planctomycetota bacterium]|nr:MAG: glutamate 5-kinase [Planctomycetota bacterium]